MSSFLVKDLFWAFICNSYFVYVVVPGWIGGVQGWPRSLAFMKLSGRYAKVLVMVCLWGGGSLGNFFPPSFLFFVFRFIYHCVFVVAAVTKYRQLDGLNICFSQF